jgi:hypothetical protein
MLSFSINKRRAIGLAALLLVVGSCGQNDQPAENTEKKEEAKKESIPSKVEKDTVIIESTDASFIKSNFKFKGKIQEFVKWTDGEGTHIAFSTLTNVQERENAEMGEFTKNRELFVHHFVQSDGTFKNTWNITDYVRDCPVDLTLSFVKKSLKVTDLDEDGIAEVWSMHRSACRGDVSPSTLKLIMYEASAKYKLEGNAIVQLSETDLEGGNITNTIGFKKGDAFFNHAQEFWKKNTKETWE